MSYNPQIYYPGEKVRPLTPMRLWKVTPLRVRGWNSFGGLEPSD